MSQKHFDLKYKCDMLEARNAELESDKDVLKIRAETLAFEVDLLKDLVGQDDEDKDAIIASFQQTIIDKDAEIANLKVTLKHATEDIAFDEIFSDNDEPNSKMGEDTGQVLEPPPKKKVRGHGPKHVQPDGTITTSHLTRENMSHEE